MKASLGKRWVPSFNSSSMPSPAAEMNMNYSKPKNREFTSKIGSEV